MASVVGKGDSEGLRKVEKDVLITKKVKEKAMKRCDNFIQGKPKCLQKYSMVSLHKMCVV